MTLGASVVAGLAPLAVLLAFVLVDGFNANQETPTEAAGRHNRGGRSAPAAPNHPARLPAPVP